MTPAISVIVPAFDAEAYLSESLASVLAQELAPAEVLVVDDGSTDATVEVALAAGDPVRVIRHDTNRGEAAARNTGLAEARGDLISMHDADDRMRPHRLRREAEHLAEAGPDTGCVMGQQRVFAESGEVPRWALADDGSPVSYPGSLILAPRATFDRVGEYDPSFANGTDSDWLVRMTANGLTLGLIDEVLTDRRIHDRNVSIAAWESGSPRAPFTRSLRQVIEARRQQP